MDQRIQIIISLMEDDLRRVPLLSELAASVNLSDSRLRHVFKAEIGTTPAQYLKALRMEKTCELLATTFLSVKEITTKVGLNNESHFVQDFKKIYGLTPTRYRARRLGDQQTQITSLASV